MNQSNTENDTWYTEEGLHTECILSTRIRLSRNLTGFIFPNKIKTDDAESVLSLVFDAFNSFNEDQNSSKEFQAIRLSSLDLRGRLILSERGVLEPGFGSEPWKGVLVRNDGKLSATVNIDEHLKLASFNAGFSIEPCFDLVSGIDTELQKKLRFSALPSLGYLTQNIFNVGSAMKISVIASLQGLCKTGLLDRIIRDYLSQGFSVQGYYGGSKNESLGCLYQIASPSSATGDISLQLSKMGQAIDKLIALEKKARTDLLNSRRTEMEDLSFRALCVAKYARFIEREEAIELLERIRLGLDLGLIIGAKNTDLTALLYRIQTAHLDFVKSTGSIIIEEDVREEDLRIDRLRAMVIQEILKNADIQEKR